MQIKNFLISILLLLCGVTPFLEVKESRTTNKSSFADWPETFEGQVLSEIPMSESEKGFHRDFPGHIARFQNGKNEIILRRIERESRKLHPAEDCYKAYGYKTEPLPVKLDQNKRTWSCIKATRNDQSYSVCEMIEDQNGNHWADVSSWYWNALLQNTKGPWLSYIVATRI